MSIPSGGASLGPQDPTTIDSADTQQTGAASQAQRQEIGMVKDTMTKSFTELGSAKIDVKGSQPDRPTLDSPITSVLVPTGAEDQTTKAAVQEKYQQFLEKLPTDVQMAILENSQLPVEQQDPQLTAFSAAIMAQATATVWSEQTLASDSAKGSEGDGTTTEGGGQASKETAVDADGKPLPQFQNVGSGGGQNSGGQFGQNPGEAQANQQTSAQFWGSNSAVPGADAMAFIKASLPPGASQLDQATLAALNGIPGPLVANLPPQLQSLIVAANGIQALTSQKTTVEAAVKATPLDSPDRVVLSDFLKVISEAIEACKEALRKMMTSQTDVEIKDAQAKTDTMKAKLTMQLEKLQKAHESGKGGTGKIIGMVILSIVAAILTVVTGGILAILLCETIIGAVAVIIIAVALAIFEMVFTISSTVAGVNVVAEIMKLLADILNAMGIPSPTAEIIIAVALLVAAILAIVLVVVLVFFCPSGAELLATMLLEVVVTVSVTIVASSSAINTILVPILTALGVPKDVAEILAMIVTLLVCLIMVLGALIAGGAMIATAGSRMVANASKVGVEGAESATKQGALLSKLSMKIGSDITIKMLRYLDVAHGLASAAAEAGHGAMALGQAIILFKKAQLAMEMGDLEEVIALFEAYLKRLDASMKQIQDSIEETMKAISGLSTMLTHIIQSMSQTVSHMHRAG